ncbi:DNA-binding transcriptional MerR regulator [Sediminihabitans luteus]|uniref:DNA-binding transcriptional MerR regulator n=1 Tax=Sediminihabitans luteus TaxID=1138585 RepID=A0A2M9D0U5_9CELL|nr:MerR family transcriptional regulator [Sediminihabitans luteus]PJJ77705.1 DNA-binding transcriptional MerR regulator [Sediminihabitans luteus]GIJ00068.1 MerR family transcriptional regulator [Sediminihabitans luteus]
MDDWSIHEVARLAGTTSRTLRHYDAIGLLSPTRVAANGYRHYDADALVRLQRILLLRELGLGLPAVAEALDGQVDEVDALRTHLGWLRSEQDRLARQVASVERTIAARTRHDTEGGRLVAKDMLDGFDHTQHKDEVERRWGKDAYARSDAWWRSMSDDERSAWQADATRLQQDWVAAATAGTDPSSEVAQALAERHVAWLGAIPGTPGHGGEPDVDYVLGLGETYVADDRFAAHYGGVEGATFVRDALAEWAIRRV